MSKANKGGYQIIDFSKLTAEVGAKLQSASIEELKSVTVTISYEDIIGYNPTYDREGYLDESIYFAESIVKQLYYSSNKVLVISGVTDKNGNICKDFISTIPFDQFEFRNAVPYADEYLYIIDNIPMSTISSVEIKRVEEWYHITINYAQEVI